MAKLSPAMIGRMTFSIVGTSLCALRSMLNNRSPIGFCRFLYNAINEGTSIGTGSELRLQHNLWNNIIHSKIGSSGGLDNSRGAWFIGMWRGVEKDHRLEIL